MASRRCLAPRRNARVDAKPVVERLSFIRDPTHWGLPFRRGLFAIPEEDFRTLYSLMTAGS